MVSGVKHQYSGQVVGVLMTIARNFGLFRNDQGVGKDVHESQDSPKSLARNSAKEKCSD